MFLWFFLFLEMAYGADSASLALLRDKIAALPWAPRQSEMVKLIGDYERVLSPEKYERTVHGQPIVGQSNNGLILYNSDLVSADPALAIKASKFYAEVALVEAARPNGDRYTKLRGRPLVTDFAGGGKNGIYPGWVFDLALKHSGGDKAEAIRIIGICGHDDMGAANPFSALLDGKEGQKHWQKLRDQLAQEVSVRESIVAGMNAEGASRQDFREITLQKNLGEIALAAMNSSPDSKHSNCPPRESIFFTPESLGAGLTISEKTRQRIVNSQGKDVSGEEPDSSFIPGKYYHIYGAAHVSCEMIRRGNDPELVAKTEPLLAWAYRTMRMYWIIKRYQEEFVPPSERSEKDWQREWERFQKESKQNLESQLSEAADQAAFWRKAIEEEQRSGNLPKRVEAEEFRRIADLVKSGKSPWADKLPISEFEKLLKVRHPELSPTGLRTAYRDYSNRLVRLERAWAANLPANELKLFYPRYSAKGLVDSSWPEDPYELFESYEQFRAAKISDWEDNLPLQEKYKKLSAERDAANLFFNSGLGQRMLAQPNSVLGVKNFVEAYLRESSPSGGRDSSSLVRVPKEWSPEREKAAKKVFDSWIVDWDWTVEQHRIGAKFAQTHCKAPRRDEEPATGEGMRKNSGSAL